MRVGIIHAGLGNVASIQRMLQRVGASAIYVSTRKECFEVDALILPGVGHYDEAMRLLRNADFIETLKERVFDEKIPILGICLGMQLLCRGSEEGSEPGLGLINADVKKFDFPYQPSLKVPHMGWNTILTARENRLLPMDDVVRRFYFVHSYKVVPSNPDISIGQCDYGGEFCAAFQEGNVYGVQFHPEKSHRFGMELMKRFVEL